MAVSSKRTVCNNERRTLWVENGVINHPSLVSNNAKLSSSALKNNLLRGGVIRCIDHHQLFPSGDDHWSLFCYWINRATGRCQGMLKKNKKWTDWPTFTRKKKDEGETKKTTTTTTTIVILLYLQLVGPFILSFTSFFATYSSSKSIQVEPHRLCDTTYYITTGRSTAVQKSKSNARLHAYQKQVDSIRQIPNPVHKKGKCNFVGSR